MAKSPLGLIRLRSNPRSVSLLKLARHRGIAFHGSSKHPLDRGFKRSCTLLTLGMAGGWVLTSLWLPVRAATMINNSGLEFDKDTTLDSNFVESHGAYKSTFGVMDLETRERTPLIIETKASDNAETIFKPSSFRSHVGTNTDFYGTPGNAVPNPTAKFTFKANKRYVLYLESSFNGRPTGILYSTDLLNSDREQHVKFVGGAEDLCSSGVMVNWDDTGSKIVRNRTQQDRDFDDFIVQLKGAACAIGGGEKTPVVSPASTPVGVLPSTPTVTGSRFPLAPFLLLGLLPFILGGGDRSSSPSGGSSSPPPSGTPGVPGTPPTNPPSCPSGNCAAVPEPMTMLGTGTAIAFGTLIQRRRKRKH